MMIMRTMTAMPAKSKALRDRKINNNAAACWELRCCLDDNKMHAYEQYFKKHAKDKIIIDLGTGPGIMGYLALKYGAKKVYCIDYSKRFIEVAKTMLADYDNVEFILGDAKNLVFPEADIVVHEIFGHNVFDEYIYDISLNLFNQGMLHKTTPCRIDWLRYMLDEYEGPTPEHRLYVKEDFPAVTQDFHKLYIKRVENFNETNIQYEPYFNPVEHRDLTILGSTDLTLIDAMTIVPKELFLDNYILKNNTKNATMFGWHAYLDDEIYYSNIVHPNNNWSAMPGSDNQWRRFKEVVRFGVNKNPYTRGIECPFSK